MRNLENKEKIVRVSGILETIAMLAMALYAYLGIVTLFDALFLRAVFNAVLSRDVLIQNPMIRTVAWLGFPTAVISFIVWWNFWKLFSRLKDGHLFDGPTVAHLATAGKWKLAGWIYYLFSDTIIQYLNEQTDGHKLVREFVRLSFIDLSHVGGLIGAVAILLAAWLLREGQTLEEDQKLTV